MPLTAPPETFDLGGTTTIRRLGFGTMQLPGPGVWGPPRDHDEAIRVLRHAVERGVTFIDTADSYGPFVAERLIYEALHPSPAELVIATEAGLARGGPDDWRPLGRPEYLRQQCELSLRHLELERIEPFQLHLRAARRHLRGRADQPLIAAHYVPALVRQTLGTDGGST